MRVRKMGTSNKESSPNNCIVCARLRRYVLGLGSNIGLAIVDASIIKKGEAAAVCGARASTIRIVGKCCLCILESITMQFLGTSRLS
jgi:hypothetical protein